MSIFVNPTQFGPAEDFERYPRDLERDRRLARDSGVDILFVPSMQTMYPGGPEGQKVWIDAGALSEELEGAARPGHFRGVTTIVAKLLNMARPDRVYFGQKDGQQAVIVARLIVDLAFPTEIRMVRTERETDGLALSSRNVYLSAAERAQASVLWRALSAASSAVSAGERDPGRLEELIAGLVCTEAPLSRLEYVSVADLESLRLLDGPMQRDALISLAVYFGSTRLIDNVIIRFDGDVPRVS
jgi:pantoate--beta-alanine ligase